MHASILRMIRRQGEYLLFLPQSNPFIDKKKTPLGLQESDQTFFAIQSKMVKRKKEREKG